MPPVESPDLIRPAESLLQGVGKQQNDQAALKAEQEAGYFKNVNEGVSNAYKLAASGAENKALILNTQLEQEGQNARKMAELAFKQDQAAKQTELQKAKTDYQNFFTMTPELADGIFKSTGGKLDFRKQVGQRMQTKVVIPLAQLYRGAITEGGKPSGGRGQKDLNALKSFKKDYESRQKNYSGMELQLKQGLAARNPQIKRQIDENLKWLEENKSKYEEAINKTGTLGGVENKAQDTDSADETEDSNTPPATSSSDEDALIDKAFGQ